MSGVALAVHQFRFEQKIFWRNPASVFFTVLLPVIFLLIFSTLFGDEHDRGARRGQDHHLLRPGIITLAVVSATWSAPRSGSPADRESGRLKRGTRHTAAELGLRRRAASATRSRSRS